MRSAFVFNTSPWHSIFRKRPVGWGARNRKRLQRVIAEANRYVQTLNDAYTDPSGDEVSARPTTQAPKVVPLPAKSDNSEVSAPGA